MDTLTEQINLIGKAFIDFALPMLIQSSVLIIILLCLDLILRKRIRAVFRYWIWMIVLVKLMLPPTLSLPTSPAYWLGDKIHSLAGHESSVSQSSVYSPVSNDYKKTSPYQNTYPQTNRAGGGMISAYHSEEMVTASPVPPKISIT